MILTLFNARLLTGSEIICDASVPFPTTSPIPAKYTNRDLCRFDTESVTTKQQIKTFRLKYVFLAAKIIKTARYVIMKLSENYPYKAAYEQCLI